MASKKSVPALPAPIRRSKARSMDAAGELALMLLRQVGEPIPDKVRYFKPFPEPTNVERSPALLLALCLYTSLPKRQKDKILSSLRHLAARRDPDAAAVIELIA